MILIRQRHLLKGIGLGLILGLVVMASYAGPGHGAEYLAEERVLPSHYPGKFDGLGHLDRIGKNEIVVDDSLHPLASHVTYATATSKHGSMGSFGVGDYVGFVTNAEKEITSLWMITKKRR
ncbi:MAG: hypothetical protein SWE60_04740 [Thermodesulfobacteriota bacterium]|nr:hypothetical protein [Thermodesulfobacteriota bacterium]